MSEGINPSTAEDWNQRGNALQGEGKFEAAVEAYRQALRLDAGHARAMSNLGAALCRQGLLAEGVAWYEKSLQRDAANLPARFNLAMAQGEMGLWPEVEKNCLRILALEPANHEALSALITAAVKQRNFEKALDYIQRQVDLDPENADSHMTRAFAYLRLGRLQEGFADLEWRYRWSGYANPLPAADIPLWQGESPESLAGFLLINWEDGYGDAFQFCRYLPLLAAQGYYLLFAVSRELLHFFQESLIHSHIRYCVRGASLPRQPAAQSGIFSLPFHCGTTLATVPAATPYLRANPIKKESWQKQLAELSPPRRRWSGPAVPPLKVGLAWAGNPAHHNDANRSLPVDVLSPLLAVEDVAFFSLQKYPEGTPQPPLPPRIIDLAPRLESFVDTAAVIDNLDLVISVDTSVAHLAGALDKPVWIMLPYWSEWRWLEDTDRSPWYPAARLFRQATPGDWAGVVRGIGQALVERVALHKRKRP